MGGSEVRNCCGVQPGAEGMKRGPLCQGFGEALSKKSAPSSLVASLSFSGAH